MKNENTVKMEELKGKELNEILTMINIKKYIPISAKLEIADTIIELATKESEVGYKFIDYNLKEIALCYALVAYYTNIDLSDNIYEVFDLMQTTNLYNYIVNIEENSLLSVEVVVYNKIREFEQKNSNLSQITYMLSQKVLGVFDETMQHVNTMLDKGDPNKIAKYLSKGIEMLAVKMPDLSTLNPLDLKRGE